MRICASGGLSATVTPHSVTSGEPIVVVVCRGAIEIAPASANAPPVPADAFGGPGYYWSPLDAQAVGGGRPASAKSAWDAVSSDVTEVRTEDGAALTIDASVLSRGEKTWLTSVGRGTIRVSPASRIEQACAEVVGEGTIDFCGCEIGEFDAHAQLLGRICGFSVSRACTLSASWNGEISGTVLATAHIGSETTRRGGQISIKRTRAAECSGGGARAVPS